MAISGDVNLLAAFSPSLPPTISRRHCITHFSPSKVDFGSLVCSAPNSLNLITEKPKWPSSSRRRNRAFVLPRSNITAAPVTQEINNVFPNVVHMGILDRLRLAWQIIFPGKSTKQSSNASIAKERLRMILFSDRCSVSDEAKRKIVEKIVSAMSEFVEIESRDKVQLCVSTDNDLGTVYSVTVPVRRVRPEFQESEEQYSGKVVGVSYKDTGESSGSVDVTFDFFVPNQNC